MKIAILLTCFNRRTKTLACLSQIHSQIGMEDNNISIYLVDDGSTDGTSVAVKKEFPEVHLIQGDGTLFWNRGMLLAWETSLKEDNYDAVVWLNDDTFLLENAIQKLIEASFYHKDSIIVGSTAWNNDHTKYSYGGYMQYNVLLEPKEKEVPCKFFNGNIVLVPSSVSKLIGLLDPYFRHAKGDFEYGVRATKKNIKIFVLPILGYCDRNPSYTKWTDKKYSVFQRLKILYSPLGNNPFEAFYYYKRISLKKAVRSFFYLHIKTIFPTFFHH